MSTWNEVLYAFDITELRTEATDTLNKALAPLPRADAVKTLIAIASLTDTEAQQQGVAEAIAQRLDGALTWNLVHTNRNQNAVRQVLDRAILLRIYSASPEEEAHFIRRGLDEDPKLYGQLLLDAVRRHPIEAHRDIASYIVWQDDRLRSLGAGKDSPWNNLRLELEYRLGADLPAYNPKLPLHIKDQDALRKILSMAAPDTRRDLAYKLTQQTQGIFQDTLMEFLVSWAEEQNNWEPFIEATDSPQDDLIGKLARATLWQLHMQAEPSVGAQALHSALRWSTWSPNPRATAFFLLLLSHQARHRPTMELWKIAPLLKGQIASETRHSLASRLRPGNTGNLTDTGQLFADALQALQTHLPDPALPQPAESSLDPASLPRPIESETFEVASLPAPATGVMDNESDPRWKRWTKKFKRS